MTYYFDGQVVTGAPTSATDVKNGSNPRGKLNLSLAGSLVIGGWNKHVGLDGPSDDWIKSFGGLIDQFRMYAKVLTASEIQSLYNSKL